MAEARVSPSDSEVAKPSPNGLFKLDTTRGSVIHRLGGVDGGTEAGRPMRLVKIYAIVAAATYGPLVAAALAGPLPVTTRVGELKLPFFLDSNVAFMFLVSLPCLAVLTLTDQHALSTALRRVQEDGVVSILDPQRLGRWVEHFRKVNVIAQIFGVAVGVTLAVLNFQTYGRKLSGFWITSQGRLLAVGYVFLFCIAVFYTLIPIYAVRICAISLFLRDVVANSRVNMLPLHPDKCGGLKPVGRLGLRNQYALSVFGVNVALLILVSLVFLKDLPSSLLGLIAAATVAYLVLGPIVFMGPLLPFRAGMLKTKSELMGEVARRLRVELLRIRSQLTAGEISGEDEKLIDRLRKIGGVIDELPVWPFDAGTVRRFLTAYVVPLIGAVGYAVLSALITRFMGQNP